MFRYEGDLPKAVETWKALFRQSSDVPLAAQLPEKIRRLQREFMEPEEAWEKSVEFFEEAIERCAGASWLDRFEMERFWALHDGLSIVVDGKPVSLISKERLLEELDSLLAKYPPAASRLVDLQRNVLVSVREGLVPESEASKARRNLDAIVQRGAPDIALEEMVVPDLAVGETSAARAASAANDPVALDSDPPAEAQRNEEAATGGRSWTAPATVAVILAAGAVVVWLLARARTSR